MKTKSKPTAEERKLQEIQIERERQLRVENARETTRAFSEQMAFRRKMRGVFSLMSSGFKGFGS